MREKVEGLPHSLATFRFVVSVFVVLIVAVTIGQAWTYRTLNKQTETNRRTLCSLIKVFVLQPRSDLTPEEQARRQQIFAQINDLIGCDLPIRPAD